MKDNGLLRKSEARKWLSWWRANGHNARIERVGRGMYRCWLELQKEMKP